MNQKNRNIFSYIILSILIFILPFSITAQEKKIEIKGTIFDGTNITVPYVSVSIIEKGIGTSSTEDGEFSILIT